MDNPLKSELNYKKLGNWDFGLYFCLRVTNWTTH